MQSFKTVAGLGVRRGLDQGPLLIVAALAVCAAAAAPAAASTTIDITGETWGYFDHNFGSNFKLYTPDPRRAAVGRLKPSVNLPTDGDYAATMEFFVPTLPSNAIITGLDLKIEGLGSSAGRIALTTYIASTSIGDPDRLFLGNLLTDNYVQAAGGVTTTDLTTTNVPNYFQALAGRYIGFSLREISRSCSPLDCFTVNVLGNVSAPDLYPLPVLSVTYDLPEPPPPLGAVPEPATWAMMIMGFGLSGAALRSRRRRPLQGDA